MDLLTETLLITLVAAIGFAHDGLGSLCIIDQSSWVR